MKTKIIFHIDMDAFFASCEEALNPSLKNKPLVVGGTRDDTRSIVSCPNYKARALGVKTAMPISRALLLVPDGNFIRGTRGLYSDFSKKVMNILRSYTPDVMPASIDEAYLDVTGVMHLYDDNPYKLAKKIKDEIRDTLGITCSVGISKSKMYSKIASKMNKPDGITLVTFGKEKEFISELPVERIPGVGKSTLQRLQKYGIKKIGDALKFDKSFFEKEIGEYSSFIYRVAEGTYNNDTVYSESEEGQKSLSKEHTFDSDIKDIDVLYKELYTLLERACSRLRKYNYQSKTITVKIKQYDFTVYQNSYTLKSYSNLESSFYQEAKNLLKKLMAKGKPIRLLGVKFSELIESDENFQGNIFLDSDKMKNLTKKLDGIRSKYKFDIVKFGKNF
jgi:Nucleotidyltransferase/DNA polymerase involved in DNA repair